MSFGFVAIATAVVGTALYSADKQRKGLHEQQDALKASQEADARKTAEAETSSQVAANAATVDAKRRRRASALSAGDPTGAVTLGGDGVALAAGGGTSTAAAGGSALSAGKPATRTLAY